MRRRVAALVILLLVVALVIWGLSSWAGRGSANTEPASGEATATATEPAPITEPTVPAPEDTSSTATVTTTSTRASDGAERTEGEEPEAESETEAAAAPIAKGSCELGDLQVKALTEQPSFSVEEQPVFFMEVHNPTDTDCVLELGDDSLRFEVYDMATNQRIWADTDCYPSVVTGNQTFEAGGDRSFKARWSVKGSQPGQCTSREQVQPGSYYLHTVIGDNASDPTPFNLT